MKKEDCNNYKLSVNEFLGQSLRTSDLIIPYCFFLVLFVANVLFIVNNGNILTDGTDERKYLKRKYNEL